MKLTLTVSPDFSPEKLAGWHIFNTWLQRKLDVDCHLEMFGSFAEQRAAIAADKIDLIYANPYDAAMLVREKGFVAVSQLWRSRKSISETGSCTRTSVSVSGVISPRVSARCTSPVLRSV